MNIVDKLNSIDKEIKKTELLMETTSKRELERIRKKLMSNDVDGVTAIRSVLSDFLHQEQEILNNLKKQKKELKQELRLNNIESMITDIHRKIGGEPKLFIEVKSGGKWNCWSDGLQTIAECQDKIKSSLKRYGKKEYRIVNQFGTEIKI